MQSHKSVNSILLIFWLDVFALSLVSLASFFYIGKSFASISFLGMALSLRTLTSAVSSHFIGELTKRINAKQLLIITQILSLFVIFMLAIGFSDKNKILILLGISILGVPYVCKNVLLTIYFKFLNLQDDEFRKRSGHREFIFGLARFFGCLCSPFLLLYFGINMIFLSATLTTLFSFLLISSIRSFPLPKMNQKENKLNSIKVFYHPATWEYICKSSSVLLLVAFIALLASSSRFAFSSHIPQIWRQLLWSIEALTMVAGSFIYIKFKQVFENRFFQFICMLNIIFLTPLLFSKSIIILIFISGMLSLFIMMGFYAFRDDYVLAAGNDDALIRGFSSFSSVQQYLIYTLSPLLLAYLFKLHNLTAVILIVLSAQITLLVLAKVASTFKEKKQIILSHNT